MGERAREIESVMEKNTSFSNNAAYHLHGNVGGSEAATFSRACVYNYSLVNYIYIVWRVGFLNKDFVEKHHYLL